MAFTRPDNNVNIWRQKPDIITGQAETVKADFDRLLNDNTNDLLTLVTELEAGTAASNIGCGGGTVQQAIDNRLAKDNETAYTPTAAYHPATKNYVDSAIGAIGGGTVGGIPVMPAVLGGADDYSVTVPSPPAPFDGQALILLPDQASTAAAMKLSYNGGVAAPIVRMLSNETDAQYASAEADWIKAGVPLLVIYSATAGKWIVQALPKPVAADLQGVVAVANGGTGLSSAPAGSYLLGAGTGAFTSKTPAQVRTDIGAAAASHTHGVADLPITYGLSDKTPGTSALATGTFYFVYE